MHGAGGEQMNWTRVGSLLPAVLASLGGCARVSLPPAEAPDAGPVQPTVIAVEPEPGRAPSAARFIVRFSAPMDEGQLIAASGRSETVVLAAAADVERAAAAIARARITAGERALFVPAAAKVGADLTSLELDPEQPLQPGPCFLLVSPRLKDGAGRKLAGSGARFAFEIEAAHELPRLLSPLPGTEAAANLAVVRALATDAGVSLVAADGGVLAGPVSGPGEVLLRLCARSARSCSALAPGAFYSLSEGGAAVPDAGFAVSRCARESAPVLEQLALVPRDTSVAAELVLDWPSSVTLEVGPPGATCAGGDCLRATAAVECAPSPCDPPSAQCAGTLRIDGLSPGTSYVARLSIADDEGHLAQAPEQAFSTLAPLPRLILAEVMIAPPPPAPRSDGQYVEILNLGPGSALLDDLALAGPDGVARPLLGAQPPLPVVLAPGARALAVGGAFDASRYPRIPPATPILRAATRRLLGKGLSERSPPALQLKSGAVELASFPGGALDCPPGSSQQRDESVPPDGDASWSCGPVSGTPGSPP